MNMQVWGFDIEFDSYRAPLPVIEGFPELERGKIDGKVLMLPAYLLARVDGGSVNLMICAGTGHQAQISGEWVYADSANVPEEWKDPIAKAIEEVRAHWPSKAILLRDTRDYQAPPPRESQQV